jgi:hypothetical protein
MSETLARGNHDIVIVTTENIALRSKGFADLPLDLISLYRISTRLERNAQAEVSAFISNSKNSTLSQTENFRAIEETPIFPGIMQPVTAGESLGYFPAALTVKRLRPLARRLLRTFFPFAVFILLRNPWRRRLLVRLGCQVLFIKTPKLHCG